MVKPIIFGLWLWINIFGLNKKFCSTKNKLYTRASRYIYTWKLQAENEKIAENFVLGLSRLCTLAWNSLSQNGQSGQWFILNSPHGTHLITTEARNIPRYSKFCLWMDVLHCSSIYHWLVDYVKGHLPSEEPTPRLQQAKPKSTVSLFRASLVHLYRRVKFIQNRWFPKM